MVQSPYFLPFFAQLFFSRAIDRWLHWAETFPSIGHGALGSFGIAKSSFESSEHGSWSSIKTVYLIFDEASTLLFNFFLGIEGETF